MTRLSWGLVMRAAPYEAGDTVVPFKLNGRAFGDARHAFRPQSTPADDVAPLKGVEPNSWSGAMSPDNTAAAPADAVPTSRFAGTLMDILDRVECARVRPEDIEHPIYKLRYEAYRRE